MAEDYADAWLAALSLRCFRRTELCIVRKNDIGVHAQDVALVC
jgi:hypothetical protein